MSKPRANHSFRDYIEVLKRELVPAMGCTEPAAAALVGARVRELLGTPPDRIVIRASRNIIKNAMHVGIPNTDLTGVAAAVALGVFKGDSSAGLEILSGIGPVHRSSAAGLLGRGAVSVELAADVPPVFIEVYASAAGGRTALASISREHTRFERVMKDGVPVEGAAGSAAAESTDRGQAVRPQEADFSIGGIYEFASRVPFEKIAFVLDSADVNMRIARHSMERGYGLAVGPAALGAAGSADPVRIALREAAAYAAAASDARMAGCALPVVINSGSGNQGITVSVPLAVLAERLAQDRERLARALCIGHLVAVMLAARKGILSALCGAFTAAIGTACGLVYLQSGSLTQAERAVDLMTGNLFGIVCDGAKATCALKILSCVEAAATSARLALGSCVPPSGIGILGRTTDATVEHIERLATVGMAELDRTVLSIMLEQ